MAATQNVPLLANSSDSDAIPSDVRELLEHFKSDDKQWKLHVAERTTKKAATIAISGVISHFTGVGSLIHVPGYFSTKTHLERLKKLTTMDNQCSDSTICAGILGYAMTQKDKKLTRQAVRSVPVASTALSAGEKVRWLYKKYKGTAGVERTAQAKLLVDHANGGCDKAKAIFVEIVCGNYTSKSAWVEGLTLLKSSHNYEYAKEKLAST